MPFNRVTLHLFIAPTKYPPLPGSVETAGVLPPETAEKTKRCPKPKHDLLVTQDTLSAGEGRHNHRRGHEHENEHEQEHGDKRLRVDRECFRYTVGVLLVDLPPFDNQVDVL